MEDPKSNHVIESSSVSGVLYVNIDQQFYMQSFKEHIKVWVILDDQPDWDAFCLESPKTEGNVTAMPKDSGGSSSPVQLGNVLFDVPSGDLKALNSTKQETSKRKPLKQKYKDMKSFTQVGGKGNQKGLETALNIDVRSSGKDRKCEKEPPPRNERKKRENITSENLPQLQQTSSSNRQRGNKKRKLVIQNDVFCEYCSKGFKTQQQFYDHRKSNRIEHACNICQKVFPFKAHLLVHLPIHKESIVNSGRSSDLLTDDNKHASLKTGEESLKCEVCDLAMSNRPVLKTHMMLHTGENAYKCCVCSKEFNSIGGFTHHMTTHRRHGNVQCKICNISFENRSELSKHQLTHEYKCDLCGDVFPNKTSRAFHYKMSHKDDILKCSECDKLFSSDAELKVHLKYHQNRNKTQCTICGRLVSRLADHMLSHSSKTEESGIYVCDKCPKQFKQKLCFQRHLRTHSEEKLYACMFCPKRFVRSGGLSRHMITHTQEKPFVCPVCGKSCTQMGNLKSHLQIHKDSGLQYCSLCGAAFSDRTSLQEHLRNIHILDRTSPGKRVATSDAVSSTR